MTKQKKTALRIRAWLKGHAWLWKGQPCDHALCETLTQGLKKARILSEDVRSESIAFEKHLEAAR